MVNIATTIPQSKKLIAAGLEPETADMKYVSIFNFTGTGQYVLDVRNIVENFDEDDIPAWSLSMLIEISNNCGWYGDEFDVGNCTPDSVLKSFVDFIYEMLTDNGEEDDTGTILEWQEKYKVKENDI